MNKKTLFCAATILLLITSCGRDTFDARSKTEYLTAGVWVLLTKQTKLASATNWTDVTSSISTCKADDLQYFNMPNTYTITEGFSKCNTTDPDVVAIGTWLMQNNETELKITTPASSKTYKLESVNENNLVIIETDSSGIVVIENRYTYKH